MCVICDKLKEISTKKPIQITCYWGDNNRNCCITSDLSKCSIEILGDDGRTLVSMPITRCPADMVYNSWDMPKESALNRMYQNVWAMLLKRPDIPESCRRLAELVILA